MEKEGKMITDWLDQNGDPKVEHFIETFLIEKMGKERYCKEFHEAFGDKNDETKWYCSKCDI